ncbi:LysR family transcriptional regulator [Paraburkholderia aspalathi]|uniref:LysR family transcriptional regulator n=1 Tax=Paraburkholderia aspalathi TaxID=1324617 RepID=UPI001B111AD6|nr:LysR family transcriptional regulator [Paraburkholderia aspalathi]CAE6737520.1 HTH-type transcriptional regulator DmlR [Paraburkholderia aspalathi]
MDRFDAMNVFVRVVEAGSLSAAARAIPMSLTSVSRHLSALETQFGMQLLRRTTRHIALTDEGRVFFERAKSILAELDEVGTLLSAGRNEPAGRLRIAAPTLLGRTVIAPLLPCFLARHSAVSVELLLIDRAVNLVEEDIHLAIRVGRLPDSALVARKLGDVRMIVCAAPSYIERRGAPCSPDELRRHDCLVFSDQPGPVDWRFKSAGTRHSARITGRLWANALDVLAAAAIDGAGIVRAPSWQVAADIECGRLRRILQDYETMPAPVNVLFERARRTSPSVRAFLDYLVESTETGPLAGMPRFGEALGAANG